MRQRWSQRGGNGVLGSARGRADDGSWWTDCAVGGLRMMFVHRLQLGFSLSWWDSGWVEEFGVGILGERDRAPLAFGARCFPARRKL
jgi:hypothetical protein